MKKDLQRIQEIYHLPPSREKPYDEMYSIFKKLYELHGELSLVKYVLKQKLLLEELYRTLRMITWVYFAELSSREIYKKSPKFTVTENEDYFRCYMGSWSLFSRREIPFEEWKDLAQEGIDILREMMQAGDLNYKKNPRYKLFKENYAKRFHQFIFDPRYSEQLQELLGD